MRCSLVRAHAAVHLRLHCLLKCDGVCSTTADIVHLLPRCLPRTRCCRLDAACHAPGELALCSTCCSQHLPFSLMAPADQAQMPMSPATMALRSESFQKGFHGLIEARCHVQSRRSRASICDRIISDQKNCHGHRWLAQHLYPHTRLSDSPADCDGALQRRYTQQHTHTSDSAGLPYGVPHHCLIKVVHTHTHSGRVYLLSFRPSSRGCCCIHGERLDPCLVE
jgi:hypothetical protein